MKTKITINNSTMYYLKLLKEQYRAASYDELLKILIEKAMKPTKSLCGAGGKMGMKGILNDLRDKNDRIVHKLAGKTMKKPLISFFGCWSKRTLKNPRDCNNGFKSLVWSFSERRIIL